MGLRLRLMFLINMTFFRSDNHGGFSADLHPLNIFSWKNDNGLLVFQHGNFLVWRPLSCWVNCWAKDQRSFLRLCLMCAKRKQWNLTAVCERPALPWFWHFKWFNNINFLYTCLFQLLSKSTCWFLVVFFRMAKTYVEHTRDRKCK